MLPGDRQSLPGQEVVLCHKPLQTQRFSTWHDACNYNDDGNNSPTGQRTHTMDSDHIDCYHCGQNMTLLGTLGNLDHWRCTGCGLQYSHPVDKQD